MIASVRRIEQSPIEIGIDEILPHPLTIPSSWGTPTNPAAVAKDAAGDVVAGVVSAVTVTLQVINFAVDGTVLTADNDYRIEIKFDISGGTLEAWGIWSAKL